MLAEIVFVLLFQKPTYPFKLIVVFFNLNIFTKYSSIFLPIFPIMSILETKFDTSDTWLLHLQTKSHHFSVNVMKPKNGMYVLFQITYVFDEGLFGLIMLGSLKLK